MNLQIAQHIEKSLYHFNFLKDIKVHGFYYIPFAKFFDLHPIIAKPHFHDFYAVLLFTKGSGNIRLNHNAFALKPQTVCLLAPNQIHSFDELKHLDGLVFFFCQDFYIQEFSFIRLLNVFSYTSQINMDVCSPRIQISDKEYIPVINLADSIISEYGSSTPVNNSAIIIRSLLNIMLLKLSELFEAKSGNSNNGKSILIHALSNLVDANFIKEQHIDFYASAFNITEKQLNDICSRHFNLGLKKILQNRLMQEARKQLLSSDLSVAEIAYKLNFQDNSYFNKVFKNNTGLTPKKFREIHSRLVP